MKNKLNLLLTLMVPIYCVYFSYLVIAFGVFRTVDEGAILRIIPVHILMMFISFYVILVLVTYMLNDKTMTNSEKMVWLIAHFITFGFSIVPLWFMKMSKAETITPKTIIQTLSSRFRK